MRRLGLRAGSIEMAIDTLGPVGRVRSSGTLSSVHRISRTSRHGFQSSDFNADMFGLNATAADADRPAPKELLANMAAATAITANQRPLTVASELDRRRPMSPTGAGDEFLLAEVNRPPADDNRNRHPPDVLDDVLGAVAQLVAA